MFNNEGVWCVIVFLFYFMIGWFTLWGFSRLTYLDYFVVWFVLMIYMVFDIKKAAKVIEEPESESEAESEFDLTNYTLKEDKVSLHLHDALSYVNIGMNNKAKKSIGKAFSELIKNDKVKHKRKKVRKVSER
jgi:Ca2+/Na+ antiporter